MTIEEHLDLLLEQSKQAIRDTNTDEMKVRIAAISLYKSSVALLIDYNKRKGAVPAPPSEMDAAPKNDGVDEDAIAGLL